jgi:enediyne polyketide synthase
MACRFPDANSPTQLWENVLAQRRSFRRIPPERLDITAYHSADRSAPDKTYVTKAAVIRDYTFDRAKYRIPGTTFRDTDIAQWLALDVAAEALANAGFHNAVGSPCDSTGVVVGNTLTGELSRANLLRLRWPFVRRTASAALRGLELGDDKCATFLEAFEGIYKEPFPAFGADTLAGGLSNTIAGRICGHFNFRGGGYTVDGACASSLLAVITACNALESGDLDLALAGGVDISLDPFELVGFAKVGALASREMRVYDRNADGFLPGEGCGFVVLMRQDDALAQRRPMSAVIRGWGMSSDGSGGITRPEVEGQLLALRRAYRRAGTTASSVAYFEGHGTGTSVGDEVELQALTAVRREGTGSPAPAAIGSIKANIGHTKAAAGLAGLIKCAMALDAQIIPPTTGCVNPRDELVANGRELECANNAKLWPVGASLTAAVSAMGFGGINTHVVLEAPVAALRRSTFSDEHRYIDSVRDAELLLLVAAEHSELSEKAIRLASAVEGMSTSEIADLSTQLSPSRGLWRAAVVGSQPEQMAENLREIGRRAGNSEHIVDSIRGIYLGHSELRNPRVGFLFPGQGAIARDIGAFARIFPDIAAWYNSQGFPADFKQEDTSVTQPAVIAASLAGLQILEAIELPGDVAIGYSVGEMSALAWACALDSTHVMALARERGRILKDYSRQNGSMATLGASVSEIVDLVDGVNVVVAGHNGPRSTTISGSQEAIARVLQTARERRIPGVHLPVAIAFHSPMVAGAKPHLESLLARTSFKQLQRTVISTVTGKPLRKDEDLARLLVQQLTSPVMFADAVRHETEVDLWIEIGAGRALATLVSGWSDKPAIPLELGSGRVAGLLNAFGAAYVLGVQVRAGALFDRRFVRPINVDRMPIFFSNPCEGAPHDSFTGDGCVEVAGPDASDSTRHLWEAETESFPVVPLDSSETTISVVKQILSDRTELPVASISETTHLLNDLHLNSIIVASLVTSCAHRLGRKAPAVPSGFADSTIGDVARFIGALPTESKNPSNEVVSGIGPWVRAFRVDWVPTDTPSDAGGHLPCKWQIVALPGDRRSPLLSRQLPQKGRGGIVVCVPESQDERALKLLIEAAREAISLRAPFSTILFLENGRGAGGFARSLYLESGGVPTSVVNLPAEHSGFVEIVAREMAAANGFTEAHYGADGVRRTPVLVHMPLRDREGTFPSMRNETLLVTGGAKGIGIECALAVARQSGARLALFGRTSVEDRSVSSALSRVRAHGISCEYVQTDVTDSDAVAESIGRLQMSGARITGVLHAAGINSPRALRDLTLDDMRSTVAPKIAGARNVFRALVDQPLKFFFCFGSIIARVGMEGEAHYALANDWLKSVIDEIRTTQPDCRSTVVEWSVWTGVGMGERLGSVDALAQRGIEPITIERGAEMLLSLLTAEQLPRRVVVTGRFKGSETLPQAAEQVPVLRFLEKVQVFYPGVELVVDADLSSGSDPYLIDHVFGGKKLLPAAIGLEAMAQAASVLVRFKGGFTVEQAKFMHPINADDEGRIRIRIAALAQDDGRVDVALLSGSTGYNVEHFRASFSAFRRSPVQPRAEPNGDCYGAEVVDLLPERDLYGRLLFHGPRFHRINHYSKLRARQCVADIDGTRSSLFGDFFSQDLVLGDPIVRDAAIHAVQACIPHAQVLPVAVSRIEIEVPHHDIGRRVVHAWERHRDGGTFTYDLEVIAVDGTVCERWLGLVLQAVGRLPVFADSCHALLGVYLERCVEELIPGGDAMLTLTASASRVLQLHDLVGRVTAAFVYRPNGKPELVDGRYVAVSHAGPITVTATATKPIGCDLELINSADGGSLRGLLADYEVSLAATISKVTGEDMLQSCLRVWTAKEAAYKIGLAINSRLHLATVADEGWITMNAGETRIAVGIIPGKGTLSSVVIAVAIAPAERSTLSPHTPRYSANPMSRRLGMGDVSLNKNESASKD